MTFPDEPTITVDGYTLSSAEAMTVRVALGNFAIFLTDEGLGDDENGKKLCAGYLAAIRNITQLMREDA
jgi:hypothetical protein